MNTIWLDTKAIFFFFVFEVAVIAFFVPLSQVKEVTANETNAYMQTYGDERGGLVIDRAKEWSNSVLHKTGFIEFLKRSFLSDTSSKSTQGFEGANNIIKDRISSVEYTVTATMVRASSMLEWLNYIGVFFIAMLINAVLEWKIKKSTYGAPSVSKHTYSKMLLKYVLFATFALLIVPIELSPELFPLSMFIALTLLSISTATLAKSF